MGSRHPNTTRSHLPPISCIARVAAPSSDSIVLPSLSRESFAKTAVRRSAGSCPSTTIFLIGDHTPRRSSQLPFPGVQVHALNPCCWIHSVDVVLTHTLTQARGFAARRC
jgi:hypothetical protein